MTLTRRFALILTTILVAAGFAAGAPAQGQAQANEAIAVNLEDGAELFKFAFDVVRVNRDVVDQTNTAVAYAECEECRTIAVAFQIVLVYSDPQIVTPQNVAVAVNYECTSCETLASAYQYVYSVPEGFRFSGKARREIARIRREIRRLIRSGLPIDEIQAEIDRLADELRTVIRDDIQRFEDRRRDRDRDDDDRDEDEENEDTETGEGTTTTTEPTETAPTEADTTPTTTEPTGTETTTTP
jgi:putative peptide zinc metalloprotease protein